MSTRSNIGVKLDNGQYQMIYCHYDGYPTHVGEVLVNFHDTYEHAIKLLEGNDIRQFHLGGEYERFDDGEAVTYNTLEDAAKGFDYVYLFIEKWRCYKRNMFNKLEEVNLYDD
jgi:hypothetical protein